MHQQIVHARGRDTVSQPLQGHPAVTQGKLHFFAVEAVLTLDAAAVADDGQVRRRLLSGHARPAFQATISNPIASRPIPSGALRLLPQLAFFSTAITPPSSSIQPRLPTPKANISSMIDQQQPTQKTP